MVGISSLVDPSALLRITVLAEIASRPKSSHRYNVQEQQEIYREEIERIWTAQLKALSNPVPPELTMEDELRARAKSRGFSMVPDTPFSGGAPTPQDWSRRGSRSPSAMSRQSSPDKEDAMSVTSRNLGIGANKAVKIRRLVNGKWQKEIVRDPAVVNAYLRQRRLIEEQEPLTGDLAPTDDPELNARRKKAYADRLNHLRRSKLMLCFFCHQDRGTDRQVAKEPGASLGPQGRQDRQRRYGTVAEERPQAGYDRRSGALARFKLGTDALHDLLAHLQQLRSERPHAYEPQVPPLGRIQPSGRRRRAPWRLDALRRAVRGYAWDGHRRVRTGSSATWDASCRH